MDTNDRLRLASMWHSMHAISQQLSPVSGCSGIELLQGEGMVDSWELWNSFRLLCEQHSQLSVALDILSSLPSASSVARWFGVPIRAAMINTNMKPLEEYYMHQKKLLNFQVAAVPGDSWKGLLAALQLQNMTSASHLLYKLSPNSHQD